MEQIVLKSAKEIEIMRRAGALLRDVLDRLVVEIKPGVSTLELDQIAQAEIEKHGAKPAFLGMYGFPNTLCTSVNEQIVHGIPNRKPLNEGDILSIDVGLVLDGYYSDSARTIPVGQVDAESKRLIEVTQRSLEIGIEQLVPGNRLGDVSWAIQSYVESQGFSVVREYTGHGIGRKLHEEPKIPNHGRAGRGVRWQEGMVVCIEPMVNVGTWKTRTLDDEWTVITADKKRSAHIEHMVAVTAKGPLVLT